MNDMKQTLLTCIEIAKLKGIFFNYKDLENAKEYVENLLDKEELDRVLEDTMSVIDDIDMLVKVCSKKAPTYDSIIKSKEVEEEIKRKLEKQKELLK